MNHLVSVGIVIMMKRMYWTVACGTIQKPDNSVITLLQFGPVAIRIARIVGTINTSGWIHREGSK